VIYLLDTNAVSDLMKALPAIANWLTGLKSEDLIVTCTIVRGEILFGIANMAPGRRRSELEQSADRVLASVRCEPIPEKAASHYAAVKVTRHRRGTPLDENDLWIAATALSFGATLVTRDQNLAGVDGMPVLNLS
jgi:predicted nucleic acid-binding protein